MRIIERWPVIRSAYGSQGVSQRNGGLLKTSVDTNRIATIVLAKMRETFETIEIVKVNVTTGHDRDGDEILRIEVIFKGTLKEVDAKHVAGASRDLRPVLEKEIDDDLYPLLSFVSKVDYDRGYKIEAH